MRHLAFSRALLVAAALVCATPVPVAAQEPPAETEAQRDGAAKVVQAAINASRANDINRWLSYFAPDAVFDIKGLRFVGREQVRESYRVAEKLGVVAELGKVQSIEVIESGWTGERVYVWQEETYTSGAVFQSYTEYEVRGGKISYIMANF